MEWIQAGNLFLFIRQSALKITVLAVLYTVNPDRAAARVDRHRQSDRQW